MLFPRARSRTICSSSASGWKECSSHYVRKLQRHRAVRRLRLTTYGMRTGARAFGYAAWMRKVGSKVLYQVKRGGRLYTLGRSGNILGPNRKYRFLQAYWAPGGRSILYYFRFHPNPAVTVQMIVGYRLR